VADTKNYCRLHYHSHAGGSVKLICRNPDLAQGTFEQCLEFAEMGRKNAGGFFSKLRDALLAGCTCGILRQEPIIDYDEGEG